MDQDRNEEPVAERQSSFQMKDLILAFFLPILVGKISIIYCGANYALYPGEGYGTGLIFAILFTVAMAARFIWRYRNYKD